MTDIPINRAFWSDIVKRVANRTRSRGDAEDLVQSAFIRFQNYSATREVTNPAAFLVKTAVNIRVDEYRREQLLSFSDNAGDCEKYCSESPLQDEVVVARARLERVKLGIEQLPPRTREIFLMHRLENQKYAAIARQLGISESAVEKHVSKATLFLVKWAKGW